MGLANYLVEQNENGDSAYLRAVELAEEINKNGPLALKLAKIAINVGVEADLRSGLAFESLCHTLTVRTKDRREGLDGPDGQNNEDVFISKLSGKGNGIYVSI